MRQIERTCRSKYDDIKSADKSNESRAKLV
jgi:hypothetical protein